MKFSVIYSFDVPEDVSVKEFQPKNLKAWDRTEGDESYGYSYLEGEWEKGKHRKYVRVMEFYDFFQFLDYLGFEYEGGNGTAIAMPGFGHGMVPCLVFNLTDPNVIGSAYASPMMNDADILMMGFELNEDREFEEENWDTVCERIEKVFKSW